MEGENFNFEKNERNFSDNPPPIPKKHSNGKKPNRRNFYIFLILVVIGIFVYFIFFENSEVENIPRNINHTEQTSNIEEQYIDDKTASNSKNEFLLKDSLANPRLSIRNGSGDEVIGLDHEGTIEAANINITENLNVTGSGFFSYLGSLVNGITKIWSTDIVTDDLNSTGNITVEGIKLENDPTNHYIYDNSTCTIVTGDTSTFYVC